MEDESDCSDGSMETQPAGRGRLFRAWFGLTPDEQKAVIVVLMLALLGIGAKIWRVC